MWSYFFRRLLLLPLTLFVIILVNFVILNLAPGEPINQLDMSREGEAVRSMDAQSANDLSHLYFRAHYGLNLPILFNPWPVFLHHRLIKPFIC